MKKVFFVWSVCVSVMVGALELAYADDSLEKQFQQALIVETGERHLEEAVAFYKKILQSSKGSDAFERKVFFRLGLCYEKLGLYQKALMAFQKSLGPIDQDREKYQLAAANVHRLKRLIKESTEKEKFEARHWKRFGGSVWQAGIDMGVSEMEGHEVFTVQKMTKGSSGLANQQMTCWAFLGYQMRRGVIFGIETGEFLPVKTRWSQSSIQGQYKFVDSQIIENRGTYVGPFMRIDCGQWMCHWQAGIGFGILMERTRIRQTNETRDLLADHVLFSGTKIYKNRNSDLAFPIQLRASWKRKDNLSWGIGVRDFIVFFMETENSGNQFVSKRRVRHIVIPHLFVALKFGRIS